MVRMMGKIGMAAAVGGAGAAAWAMLPAFQQRAVVEAGPQDVETAIGRVASGGELRLRPGNYPRIMIRTRSSDRSFTITSLDPASPARIGELALVGVSGTKVQNVLIDGTLVEKPGVGLLTVSGASDVTIENVKFTGGTGDAPIIKTHGILIRDSQRVRVEGNRFRHLMWSVGFLTSDTVTIRGNEVCDIGIDAIRGGSTDNLLIQGNVVGHFTPPEGAHPDGVQIWSTNQTRIARNIKILDNVIVRDGGGLMQGIFVRDTTSEWPFEGLEIKGNLIYGSMYHAIAVAGGRGVLVSGNRVVGYSDHKAWLTVNHVESATVTDNLAPQYVWNKNGPVELRNNKTEGRQEPGALNGLADWVAQRPAIQRASGGYLDRLITMGAGKGACEPLG